MKKKTDSRSLLSKRTWFGVCASFLSLMIVFQGCASIGSAGWVKRSAITGLLPTLEDLVPVAMRTDDLVLVGSTMEGWMIVLDSLVEASPDNRDLLLLTSRFYSYYSFGWVIDEDVERGRKLYWKAIDYGTRALRMNKKFAEALDDRVDPMEAVKLLDPKKDVEAAFYTALAQGMLLIASLEVPEALILGDLFKALDLWVVEVEETYHWAAAHTLIAIFYSIMPGIVGGGPEKALPHFERAIELNDTLMLHYWGYARYYPTLIGDEELFDQLLEKMETTPVDINPEVTALNAVSKRKGRLLDKNRGLWF